MEVVAVRVTKLLALLSVMDGRGDKEMIYGGGRNRKFMEGDRGRYKREREKKGKESIL